MMSTPATRFSYFVLLIRPNRYGGKLEVSAVFGDVQWVDEIGQHGKSRVGRGDVAVLIQRQRDDVAADVVAADEQSPVQLAAKSAAAVLHDAVGGNVLAEIIDRRCPLRIRRRADFVLRDFRKILAARRIAAVQDIMALLRIRMAVIFAWHDLE